MGRSSNKGEEILRFIEAYSHAHGYAPTVREIAAGVGLKSTASVQYQLNRLREQGLLTDAAGMRTAVPTENRQGKIPVVGLVTAGQPILAVENIRYYLPWEGENNCFALEVRGDSMKNAGILEGDIVIVRPQSAADHGDIVVALLEDEATVKRLWRKDSKILLMPENPDYAPIDGEGASLLGKVRGIIRKY